MIFPFLGKESNSSIYKNSFSTFSVITDFRTNNLMEIERSKINKR